MTAAHSMATRKVAGDDGGDGGSAYGSKGTTDGNATDGTSDR